MNSIIQVEMISSCKGLRKDYLALLLLCAVVLFALALLLWQSDFSHIVMQGHSIPLSHSHTLSADVTGPWGGGGDGVSHYR